MKEEYVFPKMTFALTLIGVIGLLLVSLAVQTVLFLDGSEGGAEFELLDPSEYSPDDADVTVMVGDGYFTQEDSDLPEDVVEAQVGDIVYFYNEGNMAHTVTLAEFGIDEYVNTGDEVYVRVTEAVEETVLDCTLHSDHEGVLTVIEASDHVWVNPSDMDREDADHEVMVGEAYFNQTTRDTDEDVVRVSVGDLVYFYNEGQMTHTVTIPDLGVDQEISPGDTVFVDMHSPVDEGLLNCKPHDHHEGVIYVEE